MQQILTLTTCLLGLLLCSSLSDLGRGFAEGKPAEVTKKNSSLILPGFQNEAPANYSALVSGDVCANFTNDNKNMEFYSPLYPYNYPNGTDCIKIISAGPGEVIRIKFLDHFHIEADESCKFDYLEVRDGQFGYSTLIDKICGTTPPPFLQSSGRHLWLRFHSDKDIQYIGFRADFEFVPSHVFRPEFEECSETLTGLDGEIESKNIRGDILSNAKTYDIPVDCTWVIQAEESQKIYLQFLQYELEKPNDCSFNFIEVYGSRTELEGQEGRMKQFCGSKSDSVTSKGNIIHLRFFTMSKDIVKTKNVFSAYYNFFRESKEGSPCNGKTEFDCTDGTCIDSSLYCNKKENCKLRNDEDEGPYCTKKPLKAISADIWVIAFIGLFLILGMCTGMFLNIYRKLKRDHEELKELREAVRKSRESMSMMMAAVTGQRSSSSSANNGGRQASTETRGSLEKSPPISSQTSGESKETVIERRSPEPSSTIAEIPYPHPYPYNPMQLPEPLHSPKQMPKEKKKDGKVSIPYAPPLPYQSPTNQPTTNQTKPREREQRSEESELCIEVRDCACQTKESLFHPTPSPSNSTSSIPSTSRRAPLARGEAVDLDQQLPRKVFKKSPDVLAYYPHPPSSISSGTSTLEPGLEHLFTSSNTSLDNIDE